MALLPRRRGADPAADQDFLDMAADMGNDRLANYAIYENYYGGEQGTRLKDRERKYLERSGITFCENFCEVVIDAQAERMRVTGFHTASSEPVDKWLDSLWERNRMDAVQGVVHTTTLMKGDGYVIADFDDRVGRPRFTYQRAEQVKCVYSDERPGETEWAAKRWNTDTKGPQNPRGAVIVRLNIYWPDRVEKWFKLHKSDGKGGWARWQDASDAAWPVPWVDDESKPLGVPVFHFRNKALGGTAGRSELRATIPLQDELNKFVIDLSDILDNLAWPQRWVTGVDDATEFKPDPGSYVKASNIDAKFGQFEAAKAEGVIKAIEKTLQRMAKRSRTPMHLLMGGDQPSGEALKSAEAGLVAKVLAAHTSFGNTWEDLMRMGLRLANTFGQNAPTLDGDEIIQTQWDDPESRNEAAEAQTVVLLVDAGLMSRKRGMAKLGIEDAEAELEAIAEEREALEEAAGQLLDSGIAVTAGRAQRVAPNQPPSREAA